MSSNMRWLQDRPKWRLNGKVIAWYRTFSDVGTTKAEFVAPGARGSAAHQETNSRTALTLQDFSAPLTSRERKLGVGAPHCRVTDVVP
jgi:hypothetical protein